MHEKVVVVSEDQEVRVYRNEWRNLYDFLNFLKHEKAYEFGLQYCEGQKVLDFGCGSGYGTEILAKVAKSIVGVDTSPVAVQHCVDHCDLLNVTFEKIVPDYTLRFDDNTFDVVVSFQVIERIPAVPRYLRLLKRVLKPGGVLLITTPPTKLGGCCPFRNLGTVATTVSTVQRGLMRNFAGSFLQFRFLGFTVTTSITTSFVPM